MLYIKLNVFFLFFFPFYCFCLIHTRFFSRLKNSKGYFASPNLPHPLSSRCIQSNFFLQLHFFNSPLFYHCFTCFAWFANINTTHLIKRRNVPMDGYRLLFFHGLQFMFSVKVFFFQVFLIEEIYD